MKPDLAAYIAKSRPCCNCGTKDSECPPGGVSELSVPSEQRLTWKCGLEKN